MLNSEKAQARKRESKGGLPKVVATVGFAAALAFGSVGTAFAAETPFGSVSQVNTGTTEVQNLLTTYGVRAGSAGADFMGVTNTNFDFTAGSASSTDQYTGYTSATAKQLAGLAIWGSSVNENVNPYYANLLYHAVSGAASQYNEATTWMSNPSASSWGDSNGSSSTVAATGASTIAGLEYSPEIIFGANKYTNWNLNSNGSNSNTNIYSNGYSATYANNDATNIWTQIYTMGQLATTADTLTGGDSVLETRYNDSDATVSAIDYEKAIKGQMLYIASQIDAHASDPYEGVAAKTVAYLYAIDSAGTGYFFVPTASGLLVGDDTGAQATTAATADDNYAANDSTINMGYMGTLPFISNTFNSGNAVNGGIVMKVEDIYKSNPACTVGASDSLSGVDVIIYNSTTASSLNGTSGGKNSSGVEKAYSLTDENVSSWASAHGFTGTQIIAGDDFGTSSNQLFFEDSDSVNGEAPLLYCQRNYTADKNARAAWAFSQVYPELYKGNNDASYAYWVDKVYHVSTANVATVAAYMTGQNELIYDSATASEMDARAEAGYQWWTSSQKALTTWSQYSFYNGSSRASYYSGDAAAEEPLNAIGIFAPSSLWTSAHNNN